jgi:hypothetical protein
LLSLVSVSVLSEEQAIGFVLEAILEPFGQGVVLSSCSIERSEATA